MTSLTIDTLKLTTKLRNRGFSDEQAIGLSEALQEVNLDQLVTRADLKLELAGLRTELSEMKYDLIKWMFGGFLGMFVMLAGVLMKVSGYH